MSRLNPSFLRLSLLPVTLGTLPASPTPTQTSTVLGLPPSPSDPDPENSCPEKREKRVTYLCFRTSSPTRGGTVWTPRDPVTHSRQGTDTDTLIRPQCVTETDLLSFVPETPHGGGL